MKKKNFFAILVMASLAATMLADDSQVTVRPQGNLIVGSDSVDLHMMSPVDPIHRDTLTAIKIIGPGPHYGTGGRLSFGDQAHMDCFNVAIGEVGNNVFYDSDQLWLHGKSGLVWTANVHAEDTVMRYVRQTGVTPTIDFGYAIKSQGVLLSSDERFKENVNPIEGALGSLAELHGVSYNLKENVSGLGMSSRKTIDVTGDEASEKGRQDKAFSKQMDAERTARANNTLHYGLLAQEIKEVFPDLVTTDKNGYMYVDYIGLIPVLINAVNELSGELAAVNGELAALKGEGETPMLAPSVKPQESAAANAMLTDRTTAVLSQNDPNPFSSDTNIGVCLPDDVAQAAIYIYDLQGKQVRRLDVPERGQTIVTLHGGDLPAGMYIYSLIADGKELASKKMILTK